MIRSTLRCFFVLALAAAADSTSAQTRLVKPSITSPTVLAPVPQVVAKNGIGKVTVYWTPVLGAVGYRVTRVNNSVEQPPETTIADDAADVFKIQQDIYSGAGLAPTGTGAGCDPSWLPDVSARCRYLDEAVVKGSSYSYRVWALYPNNVLASPSPVATVTYTNSW